MTDSISIQHLAQLLKKKNKVVVLDVRRKDDYEQSPQRIVGSDWRDPALIDDWIGSVPQDEDIVVYCVKGGPVSQSVAGQLEARACRVKFLEGGIKAWRENGGATE
ncbi:MAG: rhodanese-like domain-containing protein [Desulfobacterales bacterium]|jgi:rhodanese-related sulfurtransferase